MGRVIEPNTTRSVYEHIASLAHAPHVRQPEGLKVSPLGTVLLPHSPPLWVQSAFAVRIVKTLLLSALASPALAFRLRLLGGGIITNPDRAKETLPERDHRLVVTPDGTANCVAKLAFSVACSWRASVFIAFSLFAQLHHTRLLSRLTPSSSRTLLAASFPKALRSSPAYCNINI